MKKLIIVTMLCFANLAIANDSIFTSISNTDAQIFVDRLLRLGAGKQGIEGYREWSALLAKYTEPLPDDYERMAAFQLFAFISDVHLHVHSSEMVSEVALGVFENSPQLFIKVLGDNNYMSEVICRKLLRSVSLNDPDNMEVFIDRWKPIITRNLGHRKNTCEKIFNKYKSNKRSQSDAQ